MNLAYYYPIVFWNTANLIVDSAGVEKNDGEDTLSCDLNFEEPQDIVDDDEEENDEEEKEDWEEYDDDDDETPKIEDKQKKKVKAIDYGKIASAIGKFQIRGINIFPPDINKSTYTFTPNVENNSIHYGLRGISRISEDIIKTIMANRPYDSIEDLFSKVKLNKLQAINLIKSGALDNLTDVSREEIMRQYIFSISDQKKRLTLQNMQMLVNYGLIPESHSFYARLFLFNKFLKTNKEGIYYVLNEAAINYIDQNFNLDLLSAQDRIEQSVWDKIYKKAMDPMRAYLKENMENVLNQLNNTLFMEQWNKYARGTISKWEMDSISFYANNHELEKANTRMYNFSNFYELPEEPEIDYVFFTKEGKPVKMFKLALIAGTVLDKNKLKNTITLLTMYGVVTVKIYNTQYAHYDKQISEKDAEGKKHVIEKSWFSRGNLLMIQGVRRGDTFILKKYKNSAYPVISKIEHITEDGKIEFRYIRSEVE